MILRLLEVPVAIIAALGNKNAAKICKAINRHRVNSLKHYFYGYGSDTEEFNPAVEEVRDIKVKIGVILFLVIVCLLYYLAANWVGPEPLY